MSETKLNPFSTIWSALRARTGATTTVAVVRSKPDARQWNPELLKQLEWRRFEELCVAYYEAIGFRARITPGAPAAGVNIYLSQCEAPATTANGQAHSPISPASSAASTT